MTGVAAAPSGVLSTKLFLRKPAGAAGTRGTRGWEGAQGKVFRNTCRRGECLRSPHREEAVRMEAMEGGPFGSQETGLEPALPQAGERGGGGRWGLGLGSACTQTGATHLSGRHSTAQAGSPSGCHRWSRCCLWWLSRCSDPRHTAGPHSTHCPGCRPAGRWGSTQPGSRTRRVQPVPAPVGKPGDTTGELTTWPHCTEAETEVLGQKGRVRGHHGGRGEGSAHWKMALRQARTQVSLPA